MKPHGLDHMLNFQFQKKAADIVPKAEAKAKALREKVAERERRIAGLMKEYDISDVMLADMLQQALAAERENRSFANYMSKRSGPKGEEDVTIGAGVVNNLLTERAFIQAERAAAEKLETIARNLQDVEGQEGGVLFKRSHTLSYEELVYLGF